MNRICSRSLLLAAVFALASVATARAGPVNVSGNPNADGWDFNGNSKQLGTFTYTTSRDYNNVFDFNVYSTSFVLESGSALTNSGSWQAGDLIVGIGGTVAMTASLNDKVRFLAKFGTSNSTFEASTFGAANPIPSRPASDPFYGDGIGSSKFSGDGGVVLETPQIFGGDTPWFNTTNEGQVMLIDGVGTRVPHITRFDNEAPAGSLDSYGVIKTIFLLENQGVTGAPLLSSFENYLNISLLERNGFMDHPAPGDKFVLAIQRQADDFTKATGTFPAAVPEPSSVLMFAIGLGGLGLASLRRRSPSRSAA